MAKSFPLVSIVTPSFNQAEYLEQTIRSVLDQNYPAIEYFIVDGGSTDGSVDIIRKYESQITWWVSEPDKGQAEAINKGLSRANGEVVAWLNSDDLYMPGSITEAVNSLQVNPQAAMVYGDAMNIDIQGNVIKKLIFPDWGLDDLMAFRIICQPAVFMRRSILDQVGFLDPTYHYMLDTHLWIRMARMGTVVHVPKIFAGARFHPTAKNVAHAPGFGRETLRLLEWMKVQPEYAGLVEQHRRRIEAGAYRLNARYLLDGGLPRQALSAYYQALERDPRYTLRHWHRMIYAVMSLVGGRELAKVYYRLRNILQRDH